MNQIVFTNGQLASMREIVSAKGGANGAIIVGQHGAEVGVDNTPIEVSFADHDGYFNVLLVQADGTYVVLVR